MENSRENVIENAMDKMLSDYVDYKKYLIRFAWAAALTVAAYAAMDFWTLRNWNVDESLIVEIVDVGSTRVLSSEAQEGQENQENQENKPFQTLEIELAVRLLTGAQAGQLFPIVVTQMQGSGAELRKGHRYILVTDVFEDDSVQYSIADAFRVPSVVGVLVFVSACLVVLAGWAGVMALLGLGLSIACLLWGFVPLAVQGYPPLPLAFLAVLLISAVTVFCVVRRKQARKVALLGTLGGSAGAMLIGWLIVEIWQLSGLASEGASLLASTLEGLNIKGILLASVIIGAIGAVLDVGISITASMSELTEYDPDIPLFRLWSGGIRVGSEVLGSMINTLILAYIGTSLPVAMLINNAGVDVIGLLNDPYVGQEIVQSLAGTVGLLLTIPATATFFILQEKFLRKNFRYHEMQETMRRR